LRIPAAVTGAPKVRSDWLSFRDGAPHQLLSCMAVRRISGFHAWWCAASAAFMHGGAPQSVA